MVFLLISNLFLKLLFEWSLDIYTVNLFFSFYIYMRIPRLSITGKIQDLSPKKRSQLDDLHEQPIEVLSILDTNLSLIPELPESLEMFYCNRNRRLTQLPNLEDTDVRVLECRDNKLTSLPVLSEDIKRIDATGNELSRFPNVPRGLDALYVSDNPFTKKIKELKKMVDYIRSNPQCSHDLDMIIDLPTHHSLQLVKNNSSRLPSNIIRTIKSYSKAGYKKGRSRKKR
jgi:hypothetical protein